jgi:enoyl-CoA hydratase/carnithine racemase
VGEAPRYETIVVEVRDGVGTLTLNRPEARNALNRTLIRELGVALDALDRDSGARAVVLRGAGERAFCAGADLKGMFHEAPILEAREQYAGLARILAGIPRMRTPVIAAVHGYALSPPRTPSSGSRRSSSGCSPSW